MCIRDSVFPRRGKGRREMQYLITIHHFAQKSNSEKLLGRIGSFFSAFTAFFFGFCGRFCRWNFLRRRVLRRKPFMPPRFQHKIKKPRPSAFWRRHDARGGGQNHLAARGHIVPLRHNLPSGGFAAAKPKKIGGILMAHYAVRESPPLRGEIPISTSKNAVLPIMCGALLTGEDVRICLLYTSYRPDAPSG